MFYNVAGVLFALGIAALAWSRSRLAGGFHDGQVYAMGTGAHRTYAIVSLVFAALFAAFGLMRQETAGIVALGVFVLIAIFYSASFLQGARDWDE